MTDNAPAQPQDTIAPLPLPPGVRHPTIWRRFGSYWLEALLFAVTCGIGWIIWAMKTAARGQTPAKKVLGLRVIDANTLRPLSWAGMFFRRGIFAGIVGQAAATITLGVLYFMPFWDKRQQTIFDKVSGTYVVEDPSNAWSRPLQSEKEPHELERGLRICQACKFSSNSLDVYECRVCGSANLETLVR